MRGFGMIQREHGVQFVGLLQDVEGQLDSAERVLRGGDCQAGLDSTLAAERLYGEARAHYTEARQGQRIRYQMRFAVATKRLNFLRQSLKRCVW